MRAPLNIILKIATILLLAGQAWAAPVLTYNTGVNTGSAGSPGSPGSAGTINTTWTLTSVTGDAETGFFPMGDNQVQVGQHNAWTGGGTQTNSAWVAPFNTSTNADGLTGTNYGGGLSTFTYETTFDLAGFNISTAIINGSFSADNSAEITLNGHSLGSVTAHTSWVSFSSDVDSHFIDGTNTLRVVVTNAAGTPVNPTGFRVEYGVTADAVPEIDTSTASLPLALVALAFLVLSDRRRKAQLNV